MVVPLPLDSAPATLARLDHATAIGALVQITIQKKEILPTSFAANRFKFLRPEIHTTVPLLVANVAPPVAPLVAPIPQVNEEAVPDAENHDSD